MLVNHRVTPSIKFIHLGGVKALGESSVLPKNTTQSPQAGLEPTLLDPKVNTLTMGPPCLQHAVMYTL